MKNSISKQKLFIELSTSISISLSMKMKWKNITLKVLLSKHKDPCSKPQKKLEFVKFTQTMGLVVKEKLNLQVLLVSSENKTWVSNNKITYDKVSES